MWGWLTGADRHLSDEELVCFHDGECSSRRAAAARRHLQKCWTCRSRSERLQRAVGLYVEARAQMLEQIGAAPPRASFESRLARLQPVEPGVLGRLVQLALPSPRKWMAAMAVAGVLVVLLFFRVSPASAEEVLRQAQRAERFARTDYTARRLVVRRMRAGAPAAAGVWGERNEPAAALQEVLARNPAWSGEPLSAVAFARWRESLVRKRDELTQEAASVRVQTSVEGVVEPGTIASASLVLRETDWKPIGETLRVRRGDGWETYEIAEAPLAPREVLRSEAGSTMAPARVMTTPRLDEAAPVLPLPARVERASEVSIHEALHRVRACLGEQIEVVSEGDRWVVRGVVDLAARLGEVRAALEGLPGVEPQVKLATELMAETAARVPVAREGPLLHTALRTAPAWMDERLYERFHATAPEAQARTMAREHADRVIRQAETLWSHAWALRHLAELKDDSPALAAMVREHAAEIVQGRAALTALLDGGGVMPSASEAGPWRARVEALFFSINTAHAAVMSLYARPAGDPAEMRRLEGALRQALADSDGRAAALVRDN